MEIFMGVISDQASVVYSAGPSENPANPDKSEVVDLFRTVEGQVAGAAAGNIRATTLAGLGSGTRVGQPGQVTAGADKGEYYWSGSAWIRTGDIIDPPALQADIDGEVEARTSLIKQRDGALVVEDDAGFEISRTDTDGLTLMGKINVSPDGDGLVAMDEAGFTIFEATPTKLTHMGADVSGGGSFDLAAGRLSLDSVLRDKPRAMARYRQARAKAIQGRGRCNVLLLGDSNTVGRNALGVNLDNRRLSSPDTLARILPAYYGATRGNVMGWMIGSNGTDPTYDPRFSPGSGWASNGVVSIGGGSWKNSTTTNPLEFTPDDEWDTADIWVAIEAAATLQAGVIGSLTSYTPTTGQIVKLTYAAPTLAQQMLEIARVSGTVQVIGWDCYKAGEGMSIINAGRSGSRSDEIGDSTTWYSPLPAAAAIAPDLAVIQIGLNDIAQGIDPSVYQANLETLVAGMLSAGSDVVLVVPMHPSEPRTYPWSDYVAAMYAVAAAHDLPVIDISNRLGTYTESNAAGWQADTLHPNATGYCETAILYRSLLTF